MASVSPAATPCGEVVTNKDILKQIIFFNGPIADAMIFETHPFHGGFPRLKGVKKINP